MIDTRREEENNEHSYLGSIYINTPRRQNTPLLPKHHQEHPQNHTRILSLENLIELKIIKNGFT